MAELEARRRDVAAGVPAVAPKRKSQLREYAEALGVAILLALFIRTFVVQAFKIPSGSMLPTLLVGDHLLVNKFLYGIRIPFVGKRVKAVAGETIEIRNKVVYVNGQKIDDPHAWFEPDARLQPGSLRDNFGPF